MSENEEKSAKAEDKPQTLIFVDILGFTAITNQYRVRVQEWYDEASGFSGASTTEIQGRINRFNTVMDKCVIEERLYGGVQAMLFSDCAFLVFDTSLRAALIAVSLMRSFILYGVPVRMGLGKGTFYNIEHSTTTNVRNVTFEETLAAYRDAGIGSTHKLIDSVVWHVYLNIKPSSAYLHFFQDFTSHTDFEFCFK
jgi:hypothetical protein